MAAGGTPIRRYALALTPAGAGNEAAVTAASVPPLSGGPGSHGSGATHAFTIADSVGGTGSSPLKAGRPWHHGEPDELTHLDLLVGLSMPPCPLPRQERPTRPTTIASFQRTFPPIVRHGAGCSRAITR